MKKSSLFTIFMITFIGLMGFSFFVPLLPFFAEEFGANELTIGLLLASYAAAQFIGAPILGRLSDRYGRRPVLLISTLGTFLSLVMIGFANSLVALFVARIVDGLTGGNISVARAYIADLTDENNRARGLGLIGAAFGLGFILGPAIGGVLSAIGKDTLNPAVADGTLAFLGGFNWTYALPAFGAALVALINVFQVYFTLPESLTEEQRAQVKSMPQRTLNLMAIHHAMIRPRVGPLLNTRFYYELAFSMFHTGFPLWASVQLGLGPAEVAFTLTYVGLLSVFVQGFAIGRLTRRFDEKTLIFMACVMMAFSLLAWAWTPSVPALLVILVPLALAGGTFNTVINSAITKAAGPNEAGSIMGITASLESLTRIIGPSLGNALIGLGAWLPGVLGAAITAATGMFVWSKILNAPAPDAVTDPLESSSASAGD